MTQPSLLTTSDFTEVVTLLQACCLPTQDLNPQAMNGFFGVKHQRAMVGVVGLEVYGSYGLVRSLAVTSECRGQGIAHQLISTLEGFAKTHQIAHLVLLTQTAQTFFESLGYQTIRREDVDIGVRNSSQFTSVCPGSAVCLSKAVV